MKEYKLLDFWADWCSPCKLMNPIIDEIENDYQNVEVVRINADENKDMVQKYKIMTVPTYILIKDEEIVSIVKGAMPKYRFLQMLGLDKIQPN